MMNGSFYFGNGRLYGGPFPFFKRALIDDGLLDVLVFKRVSYFDIIRYLQDVFSAHPSAIPKSSISKRRAFGFLRLKSTSGN